MKGESGIKLAVVSYLFLVAVQLSVYWLTGIGVLFAQALEMLSDVFVSIFLLLSIRIARRPADAIHGFGYGRVENVAGLVSAVFLIFFMSVEALRESVPRLFKPVVEELNVGLGFGVVALSMVVVAIPLLSMMRGGSREGSAGTQLVSLAKDEAASVISLIGLGLVSMGYPWGDAAASSVIGVLIALSGVYLFRENVSYLVGRSPGSEFYDRIEALARSVNGVLGVHDVVAEIVGLGQVHAGLHVEVAGGTLIEDADRIAESVREKISVETGCQHCVVHVDPYKKL